AIDVELVDLDQFTCCPDPIYFKARDKVKWLTIAARNLAVAEERGLDIVTMCSGCTSTLQEARFMLAEDPELKKQINQRLKKINKEYKGTVKVKHIVVLLRDDIGIERIKASVKRPLTGVKVGIHYGCHLLKPSQIMHIDDADYPSLLENLTQALGATPLTHTEKLLCCGKGCMDDEMPLEMTYEIFDSMESVGADCMGLICPTCFNSFDMGQILIARKKNREFNLPVIYFCQMLGLAQGFAPEEVGLHLHRIKIDRIMEMIGAKEAVVEGAA
ncbi:MAG: CoB--CoM heterodisulfide reductase iron-sulfur subunit B family protein, partial [candidate division KSB1 bacterium]|nr:CoB--CoM heterodisulfide reductase iron-sulfur subunit B family protein [candidate division KSB1 bacterium]